MNNRGSIIVAFIFVILISFIGISLLTFSHTHNKIAGARARKILSTGKILQDLVYYLHQCRERIFAENISASDQPETEIFNSDFFPDLNIDGTEIGNCIAYEETQRQTHKKVRIINLIEAASQRNNYGYRSAVNIDVLSGEIPVDEFPVLIEKKIDVPVETYLEEKKIKNKSDKKVVVEETGAKIDSPRFLSDAFQVPLPGELNWEVIREKLGLETVEAPIEDGIHLLLVDDRVDLIFIQGDVERIVFSAREDVQEILFIKEGTYYEISYRPGEYFFQCWDSGVPEYCLFKEVILVNGDAWSIEQGLETAFHGTAAIRLFVSHFAVITSNLESDNFGSGTNMVQFMLFNGGQGLPGHEGIESGIVIDAAGEETKIEAALISKGKITNHSDKLNLSGSLYAADVENLGEIEVTHAKAKVDMSPYFVSGNYRYISNFFIDFIEEVYDEK